MITYSELIKIPLFEDRFKALMLNWNVGEKNYAQNRYVSQSFYHSYLWNEIVRPKIIVRDKGLDLACEGEEIIGHITVHHIIPLTEEDFISNSPILCDPEYLICMSDNTHRAIHYSDEKYLLRTLIKERKPNDTIPWR